MSKKVRTYPMIGDVSYVRSRRARRFTLSVKPWRGVRLTLPWFAGLGEAENFLLQNRDWIREKMELARKVEESGRKPLTPSQKDAETEILRKRAHEYLPRRTAELAREHGFSYRRVSLRRSRTRWGSCSPVNNINLSIFLMQLPEHLIDYVILHELVHTVHKNHSALFWELLDRHTGNAKALAKEMGRYRISL